MKWHACIACQKRHRGIDSQHQVWAGPRDLCYFVCLGGTCKNTLKNLVRFCRRVWGCASVGPEKAEERPIISESTAHATMEKATAKLPFGKPLIPSSSARATTGNIPMKLPFFLAPIVTFDSGGFTPLVGHKFEPRNCIDADATDVVATTSAAFRSVEDVLLEAHHPCATLTTRHVPRCPRAPSRRVLHGRRE